MGQIPVTILFREYATVWRIAQSDLNMPMLTQNIAISCLVISEQPCLDYLCLVGDLHKQHRTMMALPHVIH
jgi:hypothetical protein